MSVVLAGIFGAVQSNQPPCCPCKIVHPILVKPIYVNGPLILMYPGAVWHFSAGLVKGLSFTSVTLMCQTLFCRNRSLLQFAVADCGGCMWWWLRDVAVVVVCARLWRLCRKSTCMGGGVNVTCAGGVFLPSTGAYILLACVVVLL